MGELTVVAHGNETWSVKDADGGTWRPDDEAWHEIRESSDQRAAALRICQDEPMRGTWHQ